MAISKDLRLRAIKDRESGMTSQEVAGKYTVSVRWVDRVMRIKKLEGRIEANAAGRPTGTQKLADYEKEVRKAVADHPDATLEVLRQKLPIVVSVPTLHRELARLKISFKKKDIRAAEQDRPDVKERREAWRPTLRAVEAGRLIFLDETWASTNMTRRYGRCDRNRPLIDKVPFGHWKTTTLIAALRVDGVTAPLVADGPIDGDLFLGYVRQHLCPTLRAGDVVVMDNLSSHQVEGVREAIEGVGAKLMYLPPYSPDFNPIEMLFAKVKLILRKTKERTMEGLWNALGRIVDAFEPGECANYLRHCGYEIVNRQY